MATPWRRKCFILRQCRCYALNGVLAYRSVQLVIFLPFPSQEGAPAHRVRIWPMTEP
jgi:hypothetical protein